MQYKSKNNSIKIIWDHNKKKIYMDEWKNSQHIYSITIEIITSFFKKQTFIIPAQKTNKYNNIDIKNIIRIGQRMHKRKEKNTKRSFFKGKHLVFYFV